VFCARRLSEQTKSASLAARTSCLSSEGASVDFEGACVASEGFRLDSRNPCLASKAPLDKAKGVLLPAKVSLERIKASCAVIQGACVTTQDVKTAHFRHFSAENSPDAALAGERQNRLAHAGFIF